MKRRRFLDEQIIGVLNEQAAGARTADVCRKHGIGEPAVHQPIGNRSQDYRHAVERTGFLRAQLTTLRRQNAVAEAALPVTSNLALENIRFRYRISGHNPLWKPVRAFDDGHKVYIEFPRRIDQGEAPPLFVVGTDGGSELVNYRMPCRPRPHRIR